MLHPSSESSVIGEGAFGCVIKPSLECGNKKISYKNKVSKVMISKEAIKELGEYTIISKIDKNKQFYLGRPKLCNIKKTKRAILAIEKCDHLKKKYLKNNSVKNGLKMFNLLVMEDGGINLKMLANMVEVMPNTHLHVLKVKKIWVEMHRLFMGILTFQKHGIVHHDIKPQNIVFNKHNNRVNFIDFGHMRNIKFEIKKCMKSDNWIYDYPFWNYPFEIQYLNKNDYMYFASKSDVEKNRHFNILLSDLHNDAETKFVDAFSIFFDYIVHNKNRIEEKELVDKYLFAYHKLLVDQIKPGQYDEVLRKSVHTIDTYGLGMSLFYLLNCSGKFLKPDFIYEMETCLFNMTTPNLLQRFTIQESVDTFENILIQFGFIEELGFVLENHKIKKIHSNNDKLFKNMQIIEPSDISIKKMSESRLKKALKRPDCPTGYKLNMETQKCYPVHAHKKTRTRHK
jgi:serine/threonine protein kinase